MSYWVYIHTCPNEKRYVGVTTQTKPECRWGKNGEGYKDQLFGKAVRKYGWNNIKHEFWELTCESEMYYAEKYLIAYYHTTESKFGYNLSSGGEKGGLGCKHSEEFRKHRSETQKKKWLDPEYRKHRSESQKKRWSDPEYRRKQSKAHRGKTPSEETKRKYSEAAKKGWLDPEIRRKKCEALKKRWSDPEVRRKQSEVLKGKEKREETRRKIAENNRRKAKDPEFRKKLSEARKGKPQPRVKIKLPDGTVIELTKQLLTRWYINKGKEFEYVS